MYRNFLKVLKKSVCMEIFYVVKKKKRDVLVLLVLWELLFLYENCSLVVSNFMLINIIEIGNYFS